MKKYLVSYFIFSGCIFHLIFNIKPCMHLPNTKKKSTISAFPNIHTSTITNNNNPFHPLKSPTFCVTKTETEIYCQ